MRDIYQGIKPVPYIGDVQPIAKSDGSGFLLPRVFDWFNTYTVLSANVVGVGVRVDLKSLDFGTTPYEIRWRSVYIDNTQVPFPIEIYFPDTGYTVTCKPFAEKTARVYSEANNCIVYFVYDNRSGLQYSTYIPPLFVENLTFICFDTDDVSPSLDFLTLLRSSASNALRVPALADQLVSVAVSLNNAVNTRTAILNIPSSNSPTYNVQSIRSLIIRSIYITGQNVTAGPLQNGVGLLLHMSPPGVDVATILPVSGSGAGMTVPANSTIEVLDLHDLHLEYELPTFGTGAFDLEVNNNGGATNMNANISISYTITTYP